MGEPVCDQIREPCKGWDSQIQVKSIFMFADLGKTAILKEERSRAGMGFSIRE